MKLLDIIYQWLLIGIAIIVVVSPSDSDDHHLADWENEGANVLLRKANRKR